MNSNKVFELAANESFTVKNYTFFKRDVCNHLQNIFFVKAGQEMRSLGYCLQGKNGENTHILNTKYLQELLNYAVFTEDELGEIETVEGFIAKYLAEAFDVFVGFCDGHNLCRNVKEDTFKQYAMDAFIDRKASITDWVLNEDGSVDEANEFENECFLALIADSNARDFDDFINNVEPNFSWHLADDAQATAHALRLMESYNQCPALCFRRDIFQKAVKMNSNRVIVFADTANGPVVCAPRDLNRSFVFDKEEFRQVWRSCSYLNEKGELCDVQLNEITEIRTEHSEVIFKKCSEESAKSAFKQIFKDAAHFEETFGFPTNLAIDKNSPYYILQEATKRFAEQQDSSKDDMDTWNKVFDDITFDLRNRWETGKVPFLGTSVTLSNTALLERIGVVKNDDYQVEYEEGYINFEMDTIFFDVDKAFGLFCNTEKNDDYVNVYVNWYPNQFPSMVVSYMANDETREIPVILTNKQSEKLHDLLPHMCLMAVGRRPEGIWAEVQKEENVAVDENVELFDKAMREIAHLGYTVVFANDELIEFRNAPNKEGWQNGFVVSLKTANVREYSQTVKEPNTRYAGCSNAPFLHKAEVLGLCQMMAAKSNGKTLGKKSDRAVTLCRTKCSKDDENCMTQEFVVLDGQWLENNLAANDMSLPDFLNSYTSEDVDALLGDAILQGGFLFSYHPDSDEPFDCMDDMKWKFRAFADLVAQMLQDEGFEEASKAIDATFEL